MKKITDSTGFYQFRNLQDGNYTVTPSKSGVMFQPVNRVINGLAANQGSFNFTAAPPTYTINGRLVDGASGVGVSGVFVSLTGTAVRSAVTDISGRYTFSSLTPGNYVLSPSGAARSFNPSTRSVTIQAQNVTVPDFGGALLINYKIAVENWPSGIYAMNVDGSNTVRITSGLDRFPAWSGDGDRIAFMRYTSASQTASDIYVVNFDGSGLTRLTNDGAFNEHPRWSTDGTRIRFNRRTSSAGSPKMADERDFTKS